MKKLPIIILFLSTILFACSKDEEIPDPVDPVKPEPETLEEKIREAAWETKEISEEIVWKYYQFDDIFSSTQSITVFEVDLDSESLDIQIPYVESGFIKTSDAGWSVGATAAINGSFFDTKNGGSTTFLKTEGRIVTATRSGFTPYRENAGFAMDATGEVSIIAKPAGGWASLDQYTDLMASGPLLLLNGEEVEQADQAFNNNRHPRTAVGVTADNELIAVVVDGRNSEAHGMSIGELAEVMKALGCVEAMNLDGGGSSTAWVKTHGVVNYPSDNKLFDHEGERGVATALTFILD